MPLGDIWRHASGRSGAIFARRALGLGGCKRARVCDTVPGYEGGDLFPARRRTSPSVPHQNKAVAVSARNFTRSARRRTCAPAATEAGREGPGPSLPFPLFRQGRPGASGCT